jgi:type VI secretion system protein ImpH
MSFVDELVAEPWRFDFFGALRRLERQNPNQPRIGDSATSAQELVLLSQNPYMEFPASTLEGAVRTPSGKVRLFARFLGMFGPQGALPLTTTDEAYGWLLERDDAFPRFVDIVQQRFLALFYRAWADARPIAQNDRPDEDRFRTYIGSMIGVGAPAFRGVDSLPEFAKLEFAGLLAPRVKSASRLRAFLAGLVGAPIEIEEFVGSWLTLDSSERTRLGASASRVGEDCVLGAAMFAVGDKFRVRVFARDFGHYARFLPGAELAQEIGDAVFLYVGDEYDWDMELAIPAGEIAPVRLGKGAKLGWTSWMAPNWAKTDETYRKDARFHVANRLADKRAAATQPQA